MGPWIIWRQRMNEDKDKIVMIAFQVIGAIFLTLFLAAAMSGESTRVR